MADVRDGQKQSQRRATAIRPALQRKIRQQAARVLREALRGDATRNSHGSIKSLVYEPSIVAKKATLALTCRCLAYLPVLKEVLAATDLLSGKRKVSPELIFVLTFDLLFGQDLSGTGTLEDRILKRKSSLQAALSRLLIKKKVTSIDDLLTLYQPSSAVSIPQYARVNTLKKSVTEVSSSLHQSGFPVEQDDIVPNLLVLPSGTDLHKHPLVLNGCLILQGKASCLPGQVLAPQPGWEVMDACAAPGNKTVQLAALMGGVGKIYACEINSDRVQRLQETVRLAGADNIQICHRDFLGLEASSSQFSKVQAILLDPSCSGSGTAQRRLDHLLPSAANGPSISPSEVQRLEQLAQFQERALMHALSFPAVERLVYSTCSIHQRENEDVVKNVLSYALSLGFRLDSALPGWQFRGLPLFDGAHHLLRTDALRDQMDGFFVALFVRNGSSLRTGEKRSLLSSVKDVIPASKDGTRPLSESRLAADGMPIITQTASLSKLRRRKLKRQRKKLKTTAQGRAGDNFQS